MGHVDPKSNYSSIIKSISLPSYELNNLSSEIFNISKSKGWYDENGERNFGEAIALMHSELSEALEEARKGKFDLYFNENKPEGAYIELIDCMIRIMDLLGSKNVDIQHLIELKINFNKTRPNKHGKNF